MAEQQKNLIEEQGDLVEQLKRAVLNVKKAPKERLRSVGYVQGRIEGLNQIYERFLSNDSQIKGCTPKEERTGTYFTGEIYDEFTELFFDHKGALKDLLSNLQQSPSPITSPTVSGENPVDKSSFVSEDIKLPRIAIPKFAGDYSSWLTFHDLYTSMIHENTRIPPVQKMYYLKTCLQGEAEKLISHLNVTEHNYFIAWELVCKRYQNTKVLVNNTLRTLLTQAHIQTENPHAIRQLLDRTRECLATLNNLQLNTDNWDPIVIFLLVERLPRDTRQLWEQTQGSFNLPPNLPELQEFLESRFRALEALLPSSLSRPSNKGLPMKSNSYHTTHIFCPLCKGTNHPLRKCFKFGKMSAEERVKFVALKPICRNCLAQSHNVTNCSSTETCRICKQQHHTLLHMSSRPSQNKQQFTASTSLTNNELSSRSEQPQVPQLNAYIARDSNKVLLATVLVRVSSGAGEQHVLRALVDPGSEATFITKQAAQKLRLKSVHTSFQVSGLGNTVTAKASSISRLTIQPFSNNEPNLQVNALVLKSLTNFLPVREIPISHWNHIKHLPLADPTFNCPGNIDMVLGVEVYSSILQEGIVPGNSNAPTAQQTSFGWILFGPYKSNEPNPKSFHTVVMNFCAQAQEECDLLRRFWELEEVISPIQPSVEDALCENLFQANHTRNVEGRYIVKLPFAPLPDGEKKFGDSREIAIKRFRSLESRFKKDPKLYDEYRKAMEESLEDGHMQRIEEPQSNRLGSELFYLPHHAVQKEESLTTKTRVVFDASSKSSNGYSLNDRLLPGPPLQRDISLLLTEWRQHKYVFTADIARMYKQVLVEYGDSDYQRIIWRSHPNGPLVDYRLLTVTFGVTSAPFLAIRSLHQLATDEGLKFPVGAKILVRDLYVDDLFSGGSTLQEAMIARNQIDSLLKCGKFELRKWASNHKEILNDIVKDQRNSAQSVLLNKEHIVKTLGMQWIPSTDSFSYVVRPICTQPPFTKRKILSTIARLYDPLGLLSFVIISSKLLLQSLWQEALDWDDPVPHEISLKWLGFVTMLSEIKSVSIPRFMDTHPESVIQIHGFCDASQSAYGAVLYIRSETNTCIKVHLVSAKSKVAPVKSITLPRLELCGAVLLSQLIKKFLPSVSGTNVKVFAWTDSTIVLSWLRRHPNTFKTFVSNRISEIVNNLGPVAWRHVSSSDNPADYASRGIASPNALKDKLWWHGPSWLSQSEHLWPHKFPGCQFDADILELKPVKAFMSQASKEEPLEILSRFSSIIRLLRITVLCKIFANKCRGQSCDQQPEISAVKLRDARRFWIMQEQRKYFSAELECLLKGNPIHKASKLLNLHPFLDKEGTLRVGGRLANSDLSYDERHPIILPPTSHLSHLLIKEAHTVCLHGGLTLTLSLIRKRIWLLNGRKIVKKFIQQCIPCFKNSCKVQNQLMGTLPAVRLRSSRPFTYVGIDYAGPFHIRSSHLRGCRTYKGYVSIFVCLCTKAIHIEAVSDLTTNAFIAALRRFLARRGMCQRIYSDCGTTFVGAYRKLDLDIKAAIKKATLSAAQSFGIQGIEWHFIPPASPHFGGLWEAGVKSIKYHLKRIAGNTRLTYEELSTVLTQIEACLNSRPLCPLTDDILDTRVLTPGHFLIGDSLLAPPEEDLTLCKLTSLNRWNLLQRLKQDFWRAWSSEYLSRLQQRPKWLRISDNLKIGSLVLIKNENLPSNQWALGRVVQVHPGRDELVRVVTVKTRDGEYKRPVTKICLLPVESAHADTI